MRAFLVLSLIVFAAAFASSSPLHASCGGDGSVADAAEAVLERYPEGSIYLEAETTKIEAELGERKLGELSLAELKPYRDRLSVAAQKDAFIKEVASLSFSSPGAGQLKMGEVGKGIAFTGGHLALLVGGAIAPYFFLPKDVRRISYTRDDISSIAKTWGSHSFGDYLPAMGVAAGFAVADVGLRAWSSLSAKSDAKKRISSGEQEFYPKVGLDFLGFGFRY